MTKPGASSKQVSDPARHDSRQTYAKEKPGRVQAGGNAAPSQERKRALAGSPAEASGTISYENALFYATNPNELALRVQGVAGSSDTSWDEFQTDETA